MVRASSYLGSLAVLAASAVGKEIEPNADLAAELYDSGVIHEQIIASKKAEFARQREAGAYASEHHAALGDELGEGSSSWGWTSDDGREFVAIGQYQGTAFAEINSDGKLIYLGRLPQYSVPSEWREIRSYKHYMVIGSEAVGHGIQIFDMKKLLDIDPASPVTFDAKADLTSHFNALLPLGRAHNVVVNEELSYGVAVGAQPRNDTICASGLNFFDLTNPADPISLGCASGDGYVHDAQCLVYRGPDKRFEGRDICYGYNEDTLTIYDVTDKANVTNIISRISYEGASYTHQGWVLDVNNQEFLVLDDELDETGFFKSPTKAIDHNQYVIDNYIYQSHYGAGLRVLDASSISSDPTGAGVCEAAWFDIYPEDDDMEGGGYVGFVGTWSSYAYFPSGYIFINTIERGAFVVKLTGKDCPKAPVCNADNCLRSFRAESVPGRLQESQEFCKYFLSAPVKDVSVLPEHAVKNCAKEDKVAQASSACACLPAATPAP
uniref:Peptidase s41 family protein n=1 Tax=Colletotrichum fructicola (strain Nara gc5) TaxID=1213859 RepID=L2FDS6_COLFN